MIEISIFKNCYSNVGLRENFESFSELAELMECWHNRHLESKDDNMLFSAAVFNDTRAIDNVISHNGIAILDIDDAETYDLSDDILEHSFIQYSSASSTKEKRKYRLVFETDKHIEKDDCASFLNGLILWMRPFINVDESASGDIARMYFLPGTFGNDDFFRYNEGRPLNTENLIESGEFHTKATSAWNETNMESLFELMKIGYPDNQNIEWTVYRDCPFWPDRIELEYRCAASDWNIISFRIMSYIAWDALRKNYAITASEIADMMRQFDRETGAWYKDRNWEREAQRAINKQVKNY